MLSSFSRRFVHEGFDPTTVQLIISPNTQARPKLPPSAEPRSRSGSPSSGFGKTDNSPKRPMPFEDSEGETNRPRKIARGESPLKGAAGRRLDQQKRNRQPLESGQPEGQVNTHMIPPPSLPRDVLFLLSIIPKASTYHATRFKPDGMVRLIRDTHIPASVNHLNPPAPSLFSMPMHQTPQGHYSGKFLTSLARFSKLHEHHLLDSVECLHACDGRPYHNPISHVISAVEGCPHIF